MELIAKRFFDKSSYVRAKALKVSSRILRNEKIALEPFPLYLQMLKDSANRHRDATASVRKNALKLFNVLVSRFAQSRFNLEGDSQGKFRDIDFLNKNISGYEEDMKQGEITINQTI